MNISEDKMDDFVNGRLPEEEMNKIREMAKLDPDLTAAIEDVKIALAVSNQLISEDIITLTNQWRESAKNNPNDKQSKRKLSDKKSLLLLVLGFILLLILAIVVYHNFNQEAAPKNDNNAIEPHDSDSKTEPLNENSEIKSPSTNEEQSTEKVLNSNETNKVTQPQSQRKLIASRLMPPLQNESILRSSNNNETPLKTAKIIEFYNQKDLKNLESALSNQKQNSAIQILTKELIARTLFEKGAYQKAIIIFEEIAEYEMPNREDYEFMLLLSYYSLQPLESKKFNDLKNKIARDKDHTYQSKINQLI